MAGDYWQGVAAVCAAFDLAIERGQFRFGRVDRNDSLGSALGEGRSLGEVLKSRLSVTEGVYTASAVVEIAAARIVLEFDEPAAAVIKHTNPCGVGQGSTLREAWEKAFATDQQAPFGGIIAVEKIFNYNGMGQTMLFAAQRKDIPMLTAGAIIIGIVYMLATLAAVALGGPRGRRARDRGPARHPAGAVADIHPHRRQPPSPGRDEVVPVPNVPVCVGGMPLPAPPLDRQVPVVGS